MGDAINIVTKLAQTSITQFFSRVNETDVSSQSFPHPYMGDDLEISLEDVPSQIQNAHTEDVHYATAGRAVAMMKICR
jgi:hypothetical protein